MDDKKNDYLNLYSSIYDKENELTTIGLILGHRTYDSSFKNAMNELYITYNYKTSNSLEFNLKNCNDYNISAGLINYESFSGDLEDCYNKMLKTIGNIQFVEKIKGEYFYKNVNKSKSNVYSLIVKNSKLSEIPSDISPAEKSNIKSLFETAIRNSIHRYMPVNTTLWKIEYID
jgi:hypothetical protein